MMRHMRLDWYASEDEVGKVSSRAVKVWRRRFLPRVHGSLADEGDRSNEKMEEQERTSVHDARARGLDGYRDDIVFMGNGKWLSLIGLEIEGRLNAARACRHHTALADVMWLVVATERVIAGEPATVVSDAKDDDATQGEQAADEAVGPPFSDADKYHADHEEGHGVEDEKETAKVGPPNMMMLSGHPATTTPDKPQRGNGNVEDDDDDPLSWLVPAIDQTLSLDTWDTSSRIVGRQK